MLLKHWLLFLFVIGFPLFILGFRTLYFLTYHNMFLYINSMINFLSLYGFPTDFHCVDATQKIFKIPNASFL